MIKGYWKRQKKVVFALKTWKHGKVSSRKWSSIVIFHPRVSTLTTNDKAQEIVNLLKECVDLEENKNKNSLSA